MTIQVLPDALISQIAAGEVVERPASVVKELLENSVDAGATRVEVEIEEGGLKLIKVRDNGCGIAPEQVKLAFERHATSKISSVDDLFELRSLGFRGEALASVASVARVIMESCAEGERVGVRYEVDGGKEVSFESVGCAVGTCVSVLGLFHHTPARKKYMKSEKTEFGHIQTLLVQLGLAHPDVGFVLRRDGLEVMNLPSGQSLKDRVRSLFGASVANSLIPVRYEQSNLVINGFVGKPDLARRSRRHQYILVNSRPIENRMVGHAVKEGFHSLLMHEKFAWFVLDIRLDPQFVDVNVHPRKSEVKFVNQQEVFRAVRGAVHHALQGEQLSPVLGSETESFAVPVVDRAPAALRDFRPRLEAGPALFEVERCSMRPVAQIAHSYIVAESEEGLVLIDQHAAHERVRYQMLMENLQEPKQQVLLSPLTLEFGAAESSLVKDNLDHFKALGFDLEEFGDASFLLRAVPAGLEKKEPEVLLREIVGDATEVWRRDHVKDLREHLLTYTACRGAIKFGDPLTMMEMQALLRDMEKTANCSHCPHGRPAVVTLTFDKLETMFKRKNF